MAKTDPPGPPGAPSASREGGSYERVTVNLTRKSSAALAEAIKLGQDNKTDTINKALQVYALLQQVEVAGGQSGGDHLGAAVAGGTVRVNQRS
jgi:hypothetical protein